MELDKLVDYIHNKEKNLVDTEIRRMIYDAREEWLERTEFYGTLVSKTLSADTESLAFTDIMADAAAGGRIINIYNIQPDNGAYSYQPRDRFEFQYADELQASLNYVYTVKNNTVLFGRAVESGTTLLFKVTYIPYQDASALTTLSIEDIPAKYHKKLADYVLKEHYDTSKPNLADRFNMKWEDTVRESKGNIKLQTSGDNLSKWPGYGDGNHLDQMKNGTVIISS